MSPGSLLVLMLLPLLVQSFHFPLVFDCVSKEVSPTLDTDRMKTVLEAANTDFKAICRRSFLMTFLVGVFPSVASAGIDITGLPVEGGASIKSQLQTYSTSAPGDRKQQSGSSLPNPYDDSKGAEFALRYGPGASLTKLGLSLKTRYQDQVLTKYRPVSVSFEFPSDWLQLDKLAGGIQYVDQRNGDKLYILRATLPPESTLETVNKKWFGTTIFNPKGSLVSSGNDAEDYKVTSSSTSSQVVPCSSKGVCNSTRRRLGLKYTTVTGNGLRVERRGLIDAYEVDDEVIVLLTSTNAVKFDKQGAERETAEAIVDSFRVGQ